MLNKENLELEHHVRTEETRRSLETLRYLNGFPSILTLVCGMISAFAIDGCLEEFKIIKGEVVAQWCSSLPWGFLVRIR